MGETIDDRVSRARRHVERANEAIAGLSVPCPGATELAAAVGELCGVVEELASTTITGEGVLDALDAGRDDRSFPESWPRG